MDKNTKLAFVLIFAVLIGSYFFQPPKQHLSDKNAVTKSLKKDLSQQKTNQVSNAIEKQEEQLQKAEIVDDSKSEISSLKEKDVVVETSLFKAVFTTKNGALKSWKLKKYKERSDSSMLVELMRDKLQNLSTEFDFKDSRFNKAVLLVDKESLSLSDEHVKDRLSFSLVTKSGEVLFTKTYIFYNDKYSFDVEINQSNLNSFVNSPKLKVNWLNGLQFTESVYLNGKLNTNREEYFSINYYKLPNQKREELDKNDDNISVNTSIDWASTRIKYFETFIFAKNDKFTEYQHFKEKNTSSDKAYSDLGFSLTMNNSKNIKKFSVFIGPMDQSLLETYDYEFESTLNWGWNIVKPFAWAVLWMLKFLHNFISNYGVVIILMSLLINVALTPFYVKSFKSQIAMKKIQPLIKDLQKRFKNDLQKQQQETMLLYKKHKVNPLGSCLPTLLPMPVLYGMFIIFRSTIEFRGANFIWWINDLSLPEVMFNFNFKIPFYGNSFGILPIVMGVFMYLQMKDSMGDMPSGGGGAASDAMAMNGKMMKYFMPVMMVVLFNSFSSGLILYYSIGTVYRYFQQRHVKNKYKTV